MGRTAMRDADRDMWKYCHRVRWLQDVLLQEFYRMLVRMNNTKGRPQCLNWSPKA